MGFWSWFFIILGGIVVLSVVLFFAPFFVVSGVLYTTLLVRHKPEKWGRECSIPDDEEYLRMFNIGLQWDECYRSNKREVDVYSDGFHLYGEYFDFGNDRAVLIIAGRMESLLYSYYFAEPYRKSGYNILVIDNRAHGKSEGKYTSLGYKEYKDVLTWCRLLHDELGNRSVLLHGICIGASTGLFALTCRETPDYIDGLIAEGMYTTFAESFKNHLIERKKPIFPMQPFVMAHVALYSGAHVYRDGPFKRISQLKKPILFIYSKEDQYSTPEQANKLYNSCTAEKRIVWFEKGAHSRVRINATEEYDDCIASFIREVIERQNTYVNK